MSVKKIVCILCSALIIFSGCGKKGGTQDIQNQNQNKAIKIQMHQTDTLNPVLAYDETVRDALSLCYEPLFRVNSSVEPEGVLAKSYKISDDSQSVIIILKDSALWHDGKALTSEDVVYTIEYIKSQENSPYYFCVQYIEEAKAIDDLSVKLTLSRPYAQMAYSLYFPVIPKHKENIEDEITGTGAYKMVQYLPSSEITLEKNTSWHGGEAHTESVIVTMTRNNDIAASAFNTGVINVVTSRAYDLSNYALMEGTKSKKYSSARYEYMAFNQKTSVFESKFIRLAVASAINREELVEGAYNGFAVAANAPLHPRSEKVMPSVTLTEYNLENAYELLFYEGYTPNDNTGLLENKNKRGISFTITVNKENTARVKCAQQISAQLVKAGMNVSVKVLDFKEYKKAIESGSYDAYIGGVTLGNIYDFEFLLSGEGNLNSFGYSDKYMELALSQMASSPSEDSLENAILNFEEVFTREQPVCGIAFLSDVLITSGKISGEFLPTMNFPYANLYNWKIK